MNKPYSSSEELLSDDSFTRWIEGKASAGECRNWESWIDYDVSNYQLAQEARRLHASLQWAPTSSPDVERELARLHDNIGPNRAGHQPGLPEQGSRFAPLYSMAAAIALLVAIVTGIYLLVQAGQITNSGPLTARADFGHRQIVNIPGQARVTLNSGSSLQYPAHTEAGEPVEVTLRGEAFFAVKHYTGRQQRPFIVHTGAGDVQVLGTQFNVDTRGTKTEVVLKKGKVRIQTATDTTASQDGVYIMKPGEIARFVDHSSRIDVDKVNVNTYTAWMKDILHFDRTPLPEVLRQVEHTYDVRFEVRERDLLNKTISGSIENNNLETLLAALSKTLHAQVQRTDRTIVIDRRP